MDHIHHYECNHIWNGQAPEECPVCKMLNALIILSNNQQSGFAGDCTSLFGYEEREKIVFNVEHIASEALKLVGVNK